MKGVDIVEDRDGLQEEWRAHPVDLDLLYALKRLVRFDRFAWQIFNPWWQQARAYRINRALDCKRTVSDASGSKAADPFALCLSRIARAKAYIFEPTIDRKSVV